MSALLVAPASQVARLLSEHRPGRFLSLRSPGTAPPAPAGFAPADQLHLSMNDIAEDRPGLVSPTADQVAAILAFARGWDRRRPLLLHCYAGISRSTAAAYLVMSALAPERDERDLAASLRRLSPMATPNPYLVRLADAALGREGRMVAAIAAIGRGAEAFEGAPFLWPVPA